MSSDKVKCQKCGKQALSDTETKKIGRKTMKRTTYKCQNGCTSPMDGTALVVEAGSWAERRH
jgi:hypothetical protein